MRKLYKVKVTIDLMVAAENETEANQVAKSNVEKEIEQYGEPKSAEVDSFDKLPTEWKELMPYSTIPQEERTCAKLLEEVLKLKPQGKIIEVRAAPKQQLRRGRKERPNRQASPPQELETIKETPPTTALPKETTITTTTPMPPIAPPTLPKVRF